MEKLKNILLIILKNIAVLFIVFVYFFYFYNLSNNGGNNISILITIIMTIIVSMFHIFILKNTKSIINNRIYHLNHLLTFINQLKMIEVNEKNELNIFREATKYIGEKNEKIANDFNELVIQKFYESQEVLNAGIHEFSMKNQSYKFVESYLIHFCSYLKNPTDKEDKLNIIDIFVKEGFDVANYIKQYYTLKYRKFNQNLIISVISLTIMNFIFSFMGMYEQKIFLIISIITNLLLLVFLRIYKGDVIKNDLYR